MGDRNRCPRCGWHKPARAVVCEGCAEFVGQLLEQRIACSWEVLGELRREERPWINLLERERAEQREQDGG